MSPSRIFILRPVATTLLMTAIMLVGLFAYRFLPLSALPEVDYPTVQVQTFYPGASPDVMVSSVTAPLEVQFGQMPGLNQMSSRSSAGASVITLQFSLDLSLDVAEVQVSDEPAVAGHVERSSISSIVSRRASRAKRSAVAPPARAAAASQEYRGTSSQQPVRKNRAAQPLATRTKRSLRRTPSNNVMVCLRQSIA